MHFSPCHCLPRRAILAHRCLPLLLARLLPQAIPIGNHASPPPKLLDRVRWHLRVKHYSIRTEQAYIDWIRRFILSTANATPTKWVKSRSAATSPISL